MKISCLCKKKASVFRIPAPYERGTPVCLGSKGSPRGVSVFLCARYSVRTGPTLEPFSPEAGPSWVRSSHTPYSMKGAPSVRRTRAKPPSQPRGCGPPHRAPLGIQPRVTTVILHGDTAPCTMTGVTLLTELYPQSPRESACHATRGDDRSMRRPSH